MLVLLLAVVGVILLVEIWVFVLINLLLVGLGKWLGDCSSIRLFDR